MTEVGLDDNLSYAWEVKTRDGIVVLRSSARTLSFTPADDGRYEVELQVTDDDGATGSDTLDLTVSNVLPAITTASSATVAAGDVLTFNGSFQDPGNDAWRGTIDFGDGTKLPVLLNPNKSFSASHVFTAPGIYTVAITVADDDTSFGSASKTTITVIVHPVNPPPALAGFFINDGLLQRSRVETIPLNFNEDVSASLSLNDFTLQNLTTGLVISPSQMALAYEPNLNRAVLSFPLLPGQQLPEGQYRLTLNGAGVTDAQGKSLTSDQAIEFHVLRGDSNGDRVTNDLDLYQVWQNQLKSSAQRDRNHDLDGDGLVTLTDLVPVASSYGKRLLSRNDRLPGDSTSDGQVNDLDLFKVWQELTKPANTRNLQSDLNGDGQVDHVDLGVVHSGYFSHTPP